MNRWLDFRPPGGGITFLAVSCIVAGAWFGFTGGDSWYTRFACPFFLPLGVALWLKHSWARWAAFTFFTLMTAVCLLMFVNVGVSVKSVIRFLVLLGTVHALWEWDVNPGMEREYVVPGVEHSDDELSDTAGQSQNRFGDV